MEKVLLFATGVAIALASCSKEETTGINTGKGIAFRSAMGTRAVETTITNLEEFKVTALTDEGTPYFVDALFKKKDGGTTFTSDPVYYWPTEGSLSFYAYAPSSLSDVTIDNSTKSVVFAPAETISQQVDFITGNASGDKAQNEGNGVELTFDHRLAQIEVQAKNTNSAYVFKVKGVKIGKPVSSGTFDLGTQKWTSIGNNKINYTIRYEQEVQLDATAKNIMDQHGSTVNGNAMLIPQELTAWDPDTDGNNNSQNAYLSVLVNIKTKDGAQVYPATQDEYGWAAVGIGTKWESGKKYVYTLDFSNGAGNIDPEEPENPGGDIFGEGITFEVSVNPWQPANPYPGDNEI